MVASVVGLLRAEASLRLRYDVNVAQQGARWTGSLLLSRHVSQTTHILHVVEKHLGVSSGYFYR
jgi:hypothetical protein